MAVTNLIVLNKKESNFCSNLRCRIQCEEAGSGSIPYLFSPDDCQVRHIIFAEDLKGPLPEGC